MADKKISELEELIVASNTDYMPVASGTDTKKLSLDNLSKLMNVLPVPKIPVPQIRIKTFSPDLRYSPIEIYFEDHINLQWLGYSPIIALFRYTKGKRYKCFDQLNNSYVYRKKHTKWSHPVPSTQYKLMGGYAAINTATNNGALERPLITEWQVPTSAKAFERINGFSFNPLPFYTYYDFINGTMEPAQPLIFPFGYNPNERTIYPTQNKKSRVGKNAYFCFKFGIKYDGNKYIFGEPSRVVKSFPCGNGPSITGITFTMSEHYTKKWNV